MTPAFSRSLLLWLEHGGRRRHPQHPGRRRVRRGVAPGRDARTEAEQLRRLHRRRGVADPGAVHHGPSGSPWPAGSNGGLLMGAVLTQRPELFGAVVIQVPLLDMLRYHRFLIARLWIPEYGSPEDPEQFALAPGLLARTTTCGRATPYPGGAARHRGERHAGRPDARAQDGGAAAGRHLLGPAGAAAPGGAGGARRREAADRRCSTS